jgi:hypothetical protein
VLVFFFQIVTKMKTQHVLTPLNFSRANAGPSDKQRMLMLEKMCFLMWKNYKLLHTTSFLIRSYAAPLRV